MATPKLVKNTLFRQVTPVNMMQTQPYGSPVGVNVTDTANTANPSDPKPQLLSSSRTGLHTPMGQAQPRPGFFHTTGRHVPYHD